MSLGSAKSRQEYKDKRRQKDKFHLALVRTGAVVPEEIEQALMRQMWNSTMPFVTPTRTWGEGLMALFLERADWSSLPDPDYARERLEQIELESEGHRRSHEWLLEQEREERATE